MKLSKTLDLLKSETLRKIYSCLYFIQRSVNFAENLSWTGNAWVFTSTLFWINIQRFLRKILHVSFCIQVFFSIISSSFGWHKYVLLLCFVLFLVSKAFHLYKTALHMFGTCKSNKTKKLTELSYPIQTMKAPLRNAECSPGKAVGNMLILFICSLWKASKKFLNRWIK